MTDESHPTRNLLVAWIDGELSRDEADSVETHVSRCERCAPAARAMTHLLNIYRSGETPAPESVLARLMGTMDEQHPRLRRPNLGRPGITAVAAGLLLTFGLGFWAGRINRAPRPVVDRRKSEALVDSSSGFPTLPFETAAVDAGPSGFH